MNYQTFLYMLFHVKLPTVNLIVCSDNYTNFYLSFSGCHSLRRKPCLLFSPATMYTGACTIFLKELKNSFSSLGNLTPCTLKRIQFSACFKRFSWLAKPWKHLWLWYLNNQKVGWRLVEKKMKQIMSTKCSGCMISSEREFSNWTTFQS